MRIATTNPFYNCFFISYAFCCGEEKQIVSQFYTFFYQAPALLLQGVTYKAKQLLMRNGGFIEHENPSVNVGYIVNIRPFQVSHWLAEGFARLPNTADYQNHIA